MKLPWRKKKEEPVKKIDYYTFCEQFPELMVLWKREDWIHWSDRRGFNLLGPLEIEERLELLKFLKKSNKRVFFDHRKAQYNSLDRWFKFNTTDEKNEMLCQDIWVTWKGYSPVLAISIRNADDHNIVGIDHYMRENYLSKYTFKENEIVPVVLTGDHYTVPDGEVLTENELHTFIRKIKLERLNLISDK